MHINHFFVKDNVRISPLDECKTGQVGGSIDAPHL
jgi:hypothetical protein